jgi:hypothetical protein
LERIVVDEGLLQQMERANTSIVVMRASSCMTASCIGTSLTIGVAAIPSGLRVLISPVISGGLIAHGVSPRFAPGVP